jgi:hypothetical protein
MATNTQSSSPVQAEAQQEPLTHLHDSDDSFSNIHAIISSSQAYRASRSPHPIPSPTKVVVAVVEEEKEDEKSIETLQIELNRIKSGTRVIVIG